MEKSLSLPDDIGTIIVDDSFYTPETCIGASSFAEVFRLSSPTQPRKCNAVKRAAGSYRLLLQKEWRILKTLDHPNIVKVSDRFWTSPTRSFMAMEYMAGGDLFSALVDNRAPPLAIVHISKCVLSALDYIHSQSLFHKDLKPENVLLGERDITRVDFSTSVKLCDFNLSAKHGSAGADKTAGSLNYAAPEIFADTISPRAAADMYSFSVLFFALCFSMLPYGEPAFEVPEQVESAEELSAPLIIMERIARHVKTAGDSRKPPFDNRKYRSIYRHTSGMNPSDRDSAARALKRSLYSRKQLTKLAQSAPTPAPFQRTEQLRFSKGISESSLSF